MESSKRYLNRVIRQIKELSQEKRNLLVVSDFHLSEGFYEAEGNWAINEDFFFDGPFSRFLQFAQEQRARHGGAPWRLICNGDIFDFRQVAVPRNGEAAPGVEAMRVKEAARAGSDKTNLSKSEKLYGPGTTPLMSGLRADLIYAGHKRFFQALAWFIARGNEVVFIKGNHDMELHWPKTQSSIKRLLEQAYKEAQKETAPQRDLDWDGLPRDFGLTERKRIYFLPWNYYEPGRVYVEHGQQFHSTDSQEHILWPVLPWKETELELGLGELFGRYFITQLETLFPLVDNIKPFSKGITWVLTKGIPYLLTRENFWSGLKKLWQQFRHAFQGAIRIYKKSRKNQKDDSGFKERLQDELKYYGREINLGALCAQELDALKSQPQLRSKNFLWNSLIRPLLTGAGVLLLLVALWAILSFSLNINPAISALVILGGGAAWGIWQLKLKMLRPEKYLADKAAQIHQVLHRHKRGVKYVFLGHDHHAHFQRLDIDPDYGAELPAKPSFYANSGTWTAAIIHDKELVQNARQFALVRLIDDTAHLMRWNDGSGEWEPIVPY